jgi:hypothetical protein
VRAPQCGALYAYTYIYKRTDLYQWELVKGPRALGGLGGLEAPGIATLNRADGRICVKKLTPDELSAASRFPRSARRAQDARMRIDGASVIAE